MKILLFNDNPVVRKLVALSAQKTKDELSVVWSVDEIEESEYDLLIMDDALYTDETFGSLKEYVRYKSALLMATRGNAIPAGFDHIINKPFLPTDLVDMFIQIEKSLDSVQPQQETTDEQIPMEEEDSFAINLDESLGSVSSHEADEFAAESDLSLEDDLDLGEFDAIEDETATPGILDHEEVQEVQGLLEDTENDDFSLDEAVLDEEGTEISGLGELDLPEDDEFDFGSLDETEIGASALDDDDSFDFGEMIESLQEDNAAENSDVAETADQEIAALGDDSMDEAAEMDIQLPEETADEEEAFDFDMESEDLAAALDETSLSDDLVDEDIDEMALDDLQLDDLANQIEDAVGELSLDELEAEMDSAELDMELDAAMLEDLNLEVAENTGSEFDELDMLDEQELKRAIGEEDEEEIDIRVGESEHASLNVEALGEVIGKSVQMAPADQTVTSQETGSSAEGVEAIQALLKALANEEVAKSLKGLNISININFGNGK